METVGFRNVRLGCERCSSGRIDRHRHAQGYLTVVVAGSYSEAGDQGRVDAEEGDILVHWPLEAHLDIIAQPATLINLPLPSSAPKTAKFHSTGIDLAIKLARTDPCRAAELLCNGSMEIPNQVPLDWPDQLAAQLRADPSLSLSAWAAEHRLAPATVSRGFRRLYGTSPASYREEARTLHALRAIFSTAESLAQIASVTGFADQPHMTRSIVRLSNRSPAHWRGQVKSVQDSAQSPR